MEIRLHPIYCPRCNRKVMAWNDRTVAPISAKCRNCNILVTYNPLTGETRTEKIPPRGTTSGTRFY